MKLEPRYCPPQLIGNAPPPPPPRRRPAWGSSSGSNRPRDRSGADRPRPCASSSALPWRLAPRAPLGAQVPHQVRGGRRLVQELLHVGSRPLQRLGHQDPLDGLVVDAEGDRGPVHPEDRRAVAPKALPRSEE